jgi:hypothetical protein
MAAVLATLMMTLAPTATASDPSLGLQSPFGKPGSVMIYPYVNTAEGRTLVTITNTNGSHVYCGEGVPDIFEGTIRVKLVYVFPEEGPGGQIVCSLEDRILVLTPNDTISFFADDLFEDDQEGWLIVAAISALDVEVGDVSEPRLVDYDYLIGSAQVYVSAADYVWAYDAFTFRAYPQRVQGDAVDPMDSCGHLIVGENDTISFDNDEYDAFPLLQVIPQFFQQGTGGGAHDDFSNFLAVASTQIEGQSQINVKYFNNSEDMFSEEFMLNCFRAGDLVGEFEIFVDDFEFDGVIEPTDDPDEVPYSGWMLFYPTGRWDDYDTPGILSVFGQANSGVWYSGANNWRGPLIVETMMPRFAQFWLDLNGAE